MEDEILCRMLQKICVNFSVKVHSGDQKGVCIEDKYRLIVKLLFVFEFPRIHCFGT